VTAESLGPSGLFQLLGQWADPPAASESKNEPEKGAYREEEVSYLLRLIRALSENRNGVGIHLIRRSHDQVNSARQDSFR
jgi:hypothetical protein